jgi:hypothetical protein
MSGMTSGKADRLKKLASELLCVKCQTRPRLANRQRCRKCLKIDTERELAARPHLLAARGGATSNHQKGASTAPTTPTGKALVAARRVQPAPAKQTRQLQPLEMEKPFTLKQWASMGARWLSKFLRAKPAEQREKADRAMAAEHAMQNVGFARITYGTVPLAALYPRTNQDLAVVQWGLERQGVRIDTVDAFGDVQDVKRLCEFCNARVRVPCTESRAQSCRNRSRNW